jgi:hypothetical protein
MSPEEYAERVQGEFVGKGIAMMDGPTLKIVAAQIRAAVEEERERCAQTCLNEYGRWKGVSRNSHGIAIGAIGAASNILCAIERIPSVASEPLNENERVEEFSA